jgi:hypothetical protein
MTRPAYEGEAGLYSLLSGSSPEYNSSEELPNYPLVAIGDE